MGKIKFQLHTPELTLRLEGVGEAGFGIGSHYINSDVAGLGGRLCTDVLVPSSVNSVTGSLSGWGVGACYGRLFDGDGGTQQRFSLGARLFALDGSLLIPVDLSYLLRDLDDGGTQKGVLLNIGALDVLRGLDAGPGSNPYFGAMIGLGGIGGHGEGGFFLELQAVLGLQLNP